MKKPAKILIWETLSFMGGGQRVSLQAGKALRGSGLYECSFILPGRGPLFDAAEADGFGIHLLPISAYSLGKKTLCDYARYLVDTIRCLFRFRAICCKMKPDALYVVGTRALIWSVLFGKFFGIPVIWHIHHLFVDSRIVWALQRFGRLRALRLAICVSQSVGDQYPRLEHKRVVLYNGVDLADFPRSERTLEGEGFRAEFGIPSDAPILLFVGALQRPKRQDVLLRAMADVLRKFPDTHLLLAGGGRPGEEDYEAHLHGLVTNLGLEKCVHFIGFREDVPRLLFLSDCVVFSGEEACPLALLESCAAWTPVIVSDRGGATELVKAGQCGLVYSFGDSVDLSRRITELLGNKSLQTELGEKGRHFAEENSLTEFDRELCFLFGESLAQDY